MAAPDLRPPPRPRLRLSARSAVLAVAMLGATLAVLRLLEAAQRVIGWLLVAATFAALLHPVVARLQRRVPRGLAVAVVMAGALGAAAAVGFGLVDDIQDETRRLQDAAPGRAEKLERSERFGELARDLDLAARTRRFLDELPERLRGGTPAQALRAAATRGVAFLATGVLTVFLLLHGPRLAKAAASQLHDERRRAQLERVGEAVYRRAFGYARGSLAMAGMAGLFGYAAARMADLPGPAPLGFWVGLWDLVPVAGAFSGALPLVALAAATSGERALALAAVFVAYQAGEYLLLQRRLEARTLRVGPFVTLAAGLVGIELSGVAGALLCVLAAAMAMAAADELAAEDEPAADVQGPADEPPAAQEPGPAEGAAAPEGLGPLDGAAAP